MTATVQPRSTTRLKRLWRHLLTDQRAATRLFPLRVLTTLEQATRHGEQLHRGQVRLAVEASLPLAAVRRGMSPRERALEVFGLLRVWDTESNCGVLIYVLVADRAVEIVADRGIHRQVGDATWRAICDRIDQRFKAGDFAQGAQQGIVEIGSLLAFHFPRSGKESVGARQNEMPDAPVML